MRLYFIIFGNLKPKIHQMAKLPDGLFGGFRGRIGNVIGVKRGDTFYVRSAPARVKNPKTEKQQAHRSRFSLASKMASRLAPFISVSLQNSTHKTTRGAFISYNMKAAMEQTDEGITINYPELIISTGVLKQVDSPAAERTENDGKPFIRFTWQNNSGKGNARSDDKILVLALSEKKKIAHYLLDAATRADEAADLELPSSIADEPLHVYLCLLSKDGKLSSPSAWLGKV